MVADGEVRGAERLGKAQGALELFGRGISPPLFQVGLRERRVPVGPDRFKEGDETNEGMGQARVGPIEVDEAGGHYGDVVAVQVAVFEGVGQAARFEGGAGGGEQRGQGVKLGELLGIEALGRAQEQVVVVIEDGGELAGENAEAPVGAAGGQKRVRLGGGSDLEARVLAQRVGPHGQV